MTKPHGRVLVGASVVVALFVLCAASFLAALAIKTWAVKPFSVPSVSMSPTIESGDRILVGKVSGTVRRGDIVVINIAAASQRPVVKRVIAVGGQRVDMRDGIVSVDGNALDEPYVNASERDTFTMETPANLPAGYLWVMGDNRTRSGDSRHFGPIPASAVVGKVVRIYWPPNRVRRF